MFKTNCSRQEDIAEISSPLQDPLEQAEIQAELESFSYITDQIDQNREEESFDANASDLSQISLFNKEEPKDNGSLEDQGSWSEITIDDWEDPAYLNEETNGDHGDPDHEVKKKQTKKPQKFSEEAKALVREFRAMLEGQGISYFAQDWYLKSYSSCESLLKMGVTPDEIRQALKWFLADEWHRKNAVDFTYIKKNFGRYQAAKNQPSNSTPTKTEYKRDCYGRYTRDENGDPAKDPEIRFRELDEGAQTRRLLAKGSIDPNTRQPVKERLQEDKDLQLYIIEHCESNPAFMREWGPLYQVAKGIARNSQNKAPSSVCERG